MAWVKVVNTVCERLTRARDFGLCFPKTFLSAVIGVCGSWNYNIQSSLHNEIEMPLCLGVNDKLRPNNIESRPIHPR